MQDKVSLWLVIAMIFAGITLGILLASFMINSGQLYYLSFISLTAMLCCMIVYVVDERRIM